MFIATIKIYLSEIREAVEQKASFIGRWLMVLAVLATVGGWGATVVLYLRVFGDQFKRDPLLPGLIGTAFLFLLIGLRLARR
jgi:hypothetical protein